MNNRFIKLVIQVFFLFLICFSIRILVAVPGIKSPDRLLFRKDTSFYLNPALSLYEHGIYNTGPDSNKPENFRPPGFPILLSLLFKVVNKNLSYTVICLCCISALTVIPVFCLTYLLTKSKVAGTISALFFSLNLTSIANAPLFLSDSFFSLLIAWHIYFFIRFGMNKSIKSLFLSILFLFFAVYTRRAAMYIIFPEAGIIMFVPFLDFKKKTSLAILASVIFLSSLLPWMYRNYKNDLGFTFDSNYSVFLLYNAAFVKAKENNIPLTQVRKEWHEEFEALMKAYPNTYNNPKQLMKLKMNRVKDIFLKYPFKFIFLHLNPLNIRILLPDVAAFFEILGITSPDKGTLVVLHKYGIWSAAKHYFGKNISVIFWISPLLLVSFLMYFGFFSQIFVFIIHKNFFLFLFYGLISLTFFMMAGPIIIPRYQLPVLPLMCSAASIYIFNLVQKIKR